MDRERIDDLWDRFLMGETLSGDEERDLLQALSSSDDVRADLLDEEEIECTLAALGRSRADAQEFVGSFSHQLALEGDKANFVNEFKARWARRAQPKRRRPWMLFAAAAAIVAVALGSVLVVSRGPEQLSPRITRVRGKVLRLPDRSEVAPGQDLLGGQGLESQGPGSGADLDFSDGTRLTLGEDAILGRIEESAQGKRVTLSKGIVRATVSSQPSGRPMEFTTPSGIATVLGTTLRLTVDNERARLEVEKGKVQFRNLEGRSVLVESGHFAVAAPGVALTSRPVTATEYSRRSILLEGGPPADLMPYGAHVVRFSPDGRLLATISGDGPLRLWDVSTGRLERTITGSQESFRCLAFSRDGKKIYAGSEGRVGGIRVWEVATGLRIEELMSKQVRTLALAPNGTLLAGAGMDYSVELCDLATGKERTLQGLGDVVHCTAFSSDGRLVAAAGRSRTVKWWDVASGQERGSAGMAVHHVSSLAFSPDGSLLAASGGAGGLRPHVQLWDPLTGLVRPILQGLRNVEVYAIGFTPDGSSFAAGLDDGTVDLWDARTGEKVLTLREGKAPVLALEFSPDSRTLTVMGGDGVVRFWVASHNLK